MRNKFSYIGFMCVISLFFMGSCTFFQAAETVLEPVVEQVIEDEIQKAIKSP